MSSVTTTAERERPASRVCVPSEGENGLFTQSWFAVCLSTDVAPGRIFNAPFLDGKVIAIRDEKGVARVLSAYCLHMGADLSNGRMIDGGIQCPFHHWRYDCDGKCVRTGIGDPVPARAQLFQFPTEERCGVVFAFNGAEALYPIPDPFAPYESEELLLVTRRDHRSPWPVDPWVVRANTPDWQHFGFVHGMTNTQRLGTDSYRWSEHAVNLDTTVTLSDAKHSRLEYHIQITGTTFWHHQGLLDGRWHMSMSGLGLPRSGSCEHYYTCAVHKGDGSQASETEARNFLDEFMLTFEKMLDEDDQILRGLRYKPALLTASDASLARYLEYVRKFPRANPARDFIS